MEKNVVISYLDANNCTVRFNSYTPIAYAAASLALATHIHPIRALSLIFSHDDVLHDASGYDTALDAVEGIIGSEGLEVYSELGDLSDDFRLIGHLEALSNVLGNFIDDSGCSLAEMSALFAERQIWERMSCSGKSWVSSGIDWATQHLKEIAGIK